MTAVALPRRTVNMEDVPHRWPRSLGGDNGTIALPSRQAALEGTGAPERPGQLPPTDGARGAIASLVLYVTGWNWASLASRRNATPQGYAQTVYVRQTVPNVVPIHRFAAPEEATTGGTRNASGGGGEPMSAIPYSRRGVVQTLYAIYDNRLWAPYYPREQIQQPQMPRRIQAGPGANARMAKPYQPMLTRLNPTVTYGQQATVIGETPPKGK